MGPAWRIQRFGKRRKGEKLRRATCRKFGCLRLLFASQARPPAAKPLPRNRRPRAACRVPCTSRLQNVNVAEGARTIPHAIPAAPLFTLTLSRYRCIIHHHRVRYVTASDCARLMVRSGGSSSEAHLSLLPSFIAFGFFSSPHHLIS